MNTLKDLNNDTSFTFTVGDVEEKLEKPQKLLTPEVLLKARTSRNAKFEDFSHKNDKEARMIYSNTNGLVAAVHYAYVNHYPLKISVSDFILMIGQGLAKHLELHSDDLKPQFVDFQGQEVLTIEKFDFTMGAENDFSTIFGDFTEKIRERVKTDLYDIMIDDTSVSTKLSRIASEITIMDTFKNYFKYEMLFGCGITKVTLVGSSSDWERLRSKVRKLAELNKDDRLYLSWWLKELIPVVDKIVDQAVSRKIDKSFWSGIYHSYSPEKKKIYEPSHLISGWLNVFNPYIMAGDKLRKNTFGKIDPNNLISGVSTVPFKILDLNTGKKYSMKIYGGFLGARILEDRTVETVYFYAISNEGEEGQKNERKKSKRQVF